MINEAGLNHRRLSVRLEKQSALTAEKLREALCYDPSTGIFTRKIRASNAKAGDVAGSAGARYSVIWLNGRKYLAHRLAWLYMTGEWPRMYIDHINGNGMDNRFSNLRVATDRLNRENLRSARSDNRSSGLLGAHWCEYHKKWKSHIRHCGRLKHLGYFSSAKEAHARYLEAKRILHEGCTI